MAIGPSQIKQNLTTEDTEYIERIEKEIDSRLLKTYEGGEPITLGVYGLPRPLVCDEIMKRYKEQGWKSVGVRRTPLFLLTWFTFSE